MGAHQKSSRESSSTGLPTTAGYRRLRITVGEYRILYTIDDGTRVVTIYLLFQRGEGYPR
ncbi:MAG: type II toxin-antitoxin system RelE/ParE family toxin [Thermoflexales bacterium]|nr:type II toxin-antitoxin system RelE/ParE family toxin [Thermoflexales bacterium]